MGVFSWLTNCLIIFSLIVDVTSRRSLLSKFQLNVCRRTIASVVTTVSLLFCSPTIDFASEPIIKEALSLVEDNYYDSSFNGNDWTSVKSEYLRRYESGEDESQLVKQMLGLLGDKYSRFLDKKVFESIWKYDAVGVGLLFQSEPGKFMTVASQPIAGSSGYTEGLSKGDIVYKIDGQSTDHMTAISLLDRLSSDESATIEIEYAKESNPDIKKTVDLKRSLTIASNPVSYSTTIVNGRTIGYIKLTEFNAQAVSGMETALTTMKNLKVNDVVLDLRGNTGGGFQFALNIGGMFMKDKDMAIALGRNNEKNVFRSSYPLGVLFDGPLLLVTDGLSASSSEVLAGGLHDNCRAVLTGSKTFGKGKIQAVLGLSDGEGMALTVAQYVTPKGTVIQDQGLNPDIPLPISNAYLNLILGPLTPSVDLASIDYNKAESLLKSCNLINN